MLGYLRSGNKRTKLIWWGLTIATVFTFLLGFSFLGGLGRDSSWGARQSGSFGSVNGETITREMWQTALDGERATFRQRYGSDPTDRDLRIVEQQAWRRLVEARLLAQAGRKAGIKVTDNDIVFGMEVNPPALLQSASALQTDGKFDVNKYRQALSNPNNDWSAFEAQVRDEAPAFKLRERLVASVKVTDSETREGLRDRFQRLSAMIVQVPLADSGSSPGTPADLKRVYDEYRSRLATPQRTQLEVLAIPVQYAPEEIKAATDLANSIYQRATHGEDFTQLCKDYSEGANAEKGGVIDRAVTPADMGPVGSQLTSHKPGDILPPYREGGTVVIFRILDPARDSVARNLAPGTYKLAQLSIKVRASSEAMRDQFAKANDIAKRARSLGLGRAATEKGLATAKTPFYDYDNPPQQLFATPELVDWAVGKPKGAVSPVIDAGDVLVIAQVALQHPAGVPAMDEVGDQLKQLADFDRRAELAKPRADRIAAAIHSGASLEDAAKKEGLGAFPVNLTRADANPQLSAVPELQGQLWAGKPGQILGPVRSPVGWWFGQVTSITNAPDSLWNNQELRGQVMSDIVNRRQRSLYTGYLDQLRDHAKIVDLRNPE